MSDLRRALTRTGTLLPNSHRGGLARVITALVVSAFVRQKGRPFLSVPKNEDLVVLKELIEAGTVTPVMDRTYPLNEVPEAMRYLEEGHAPGKVVITISR